jgi:N-acetylglucosaminyldiphosphoundecaprenol N-acetyl-beta-D-mannosaminyltransferase
MAMSYDVPRRRVLGVPVDALDLAGTLAWVEHKVTSREPGTHLGVNAANVVRAHGDPDYRALLERGSVVGPDGQPFVWAAKLLRQPLPGRVAGIDLMEAVLRRAAEKGWRISLLGGRAHVVERLAARLHAEGVQVVGARDGYFAAEDEPQVVSDILQSRPDVVFVGMPSPDKERILVTRLAPAGIPVGIGVGGSFDVLAGEVRRAPLPVQRLGLEWVVRMAQEPRRLFLRYAVTNTRFVMLVVKALLTRPEPPSSKR